MTRDREFLGAVASDLGIDFYVAADNHFADRAAGGGSDNSRDIHVTAHRTTCHDQFARLIQSGRWFVPEVLEIGIHGKLA